MMIMNIAIEIYIAHAIVIYIAHGCI